MDRRQPCSITVITCTHNPRSDFLALVLEALNRQTLAKPEWEFLLIDNASLQLVATNWDLTWHPNARHIREETLGLTPARLRGIREARGEILVFVDDDNVLDRDYLKLALMTGRQFPMLGAWGGQVLPVYEVSPDPKLAPYVKNVCIRELDRDLWSNFKDWNDALPVGAGMCLRQQVAQRYLEAAENDPQRCRLDRCGTNLTYAGDVDMALTACDLDMGCGVFVKLVLYHLISGHRLTDEYLLKLKEGLTYSWVLLSGIRAETLGADRAGKLGRVLRVLRGWLKDPLKLRFSAAEWRGRRRALKDLSPR